MRQVASVWKGGAWLGAQWLLLLVIVAVSSVTQSTDPSIDARATPTGGALHIEWAISSAWYLNNSIADAEDFRVFVDGQERETVTLDVTRYDLYRLTSDTTYTVQVQGTLVNDSLAEPLYSDSLAVTTLSLAAPDAPDTPTLLAMTGGFVQVSVQPPADTGGADLANMTVIVRTAEGLAVMQQSQSSDSAAALTFNIYGLNALTAYLVTAVASNAGGKMSVQSNPLEATTKALQLPDPCPAPTVISTTGASVVLQLMPPLDDGGGRIQGYNVYMATSDVGDFTEVATTIGTDTMDVVEVLHLSESSDEPLLPETRYIFKAVAVTLVDICISVATSLQLANATDTYTAAAAIPGPPPSPYFLQTTGGMITMSLAKSLNMQGATLTGFLVTTTDATGSSVTNSIAADGAVTYNATPLQASSSYEVSAAVVTNLGTSLFSSSITMSTTAPSTPTAPRNITIVNITGSSAVAEWSLPLDSGGVDLTGYSVILISLGSQEERPALASPALLKDLAANTVYTVKMTATNAAGKKSLKSESVATSFKTRSLTIPSVPLDVSSIFASGGAIEVSWNPPADRGGERLSSMTYNTSVYSVTPCFDTRVDVLSPCSRCNSVKLLAVQQYQLIADTTMCESPSSDVVCPDGTQDCCLTRADTEYGFGLTCGRMGPARKPRVVVGTTSAVFNGLNSSSTYYFGVQAINGAGRSSTSLLQGLQTTRQTPPTYPVNLRQLTGTGGSIQLTWDAPLDSGGGPIVGYHVYRNYELLTSGYIQPPYFDCGGVVVDTRYVYGVVAVTASQAEGSMTTTELSTESVTAPVSPSLSLAGRSYNRLQMSVVPSCDTGGDALGMYQYMVQDAGSTIASSDFDCCDFTVENLKPKHSYTVLVRVSNVLAFSQWAKAVYTTTTGIPAAPVASMLQVNTYSAVVALGKSPYDREISSYDVYLRQENIQIQQYNVPCQQDAYLVEYVCPVSYRVEALEPNNFYAVNIRANGPLGLTDSSSVQFTTSGISEGTFGMEVTSYTVNKEGVISTTVLRSGGTSGSVDVGVDVTQTDTVLVRCENVSGGGCQCTLFLVASGFPSEPCTLNFADGEVQQSVTFSIWSSESAELLPSPIAVAPFGITLSGQHTALLYTDPRQQQGFVTFSTSPTEVLEDASFAMVDVVRLNGTTGELRFDFETFDISAIAGEDYIALNGTVVFANQESGTQIWIQLIDNHYINDDKMFGLRLTDQTVEGSTSVLVTHEVIVHDDESIKDAVPRRMDSPVTVYTTGGEFQVEWATSSNDTALIFGYMIRVTAASATVFNLYNTTSSPFTMSGLSARSSYRVEIAAWNWFGLGAYSDPIHVVTQNSTLPSPPLSLEATDVTNTKITLKWLLPRDDGGSAIVGYRVVVENVNGDEVISDSVDVPSLSFTVDGLCASSDYVCYVFSTTSAFPDGSSATSSAQISITTSAAEVLGPPPAVTLVGRPRGGTLEIFLNQPRDTGGMPLTSGALYLRKKTVDGSATFAVVCGLNLPDQANDNCVVSQLVANTSYEVYATFSNDMGEGRPGESSFFQTTSAIDLPSPPVNLISPVVTAGNIRLEWDVPADLGGASGVIGYIVYQKYDVLGDTYFTLYDGQDSTDRSVTARGLTRNSSYSFAVVAVNSASFCVDPVSYNLSPFRQVMTLSSSPLAPPGQPYLVSRTGGRITIGWGPPDDLAGIALESYYVELVVSTSNNDYTMLSSSLSSDTTTFTHYGLSESTSYSYTVTAKNLDGPSERSAIFTTFTAAVSQPIAVQNFRQVDATGVSIKLAWDQPLDTGGREIAYYEIVRDGRSGKFLATSTTFEDRSNLNASTDYTYTIIAFNGIYRGYSTSSLGTTGLPSPPEPPLLTSTPFGGRIEVSWRASEYTGGIPISKYEITLYNADGSTVIENVVSVDSAHVFQHLVAQTTYRLSGKAFNDAGESNLRVYYVQTSPPDDPDAPPRPVATDIWGGSVRIHVESPDYTGGDAITLILYMDGDEVYTFQSDVRDTIIYGLVAQTQYAFIVSAENSAGETTSPLLSVTTTAISTPGQVQSLALISATYKQMKLTWDAVQNTGGDENLEYDVTYSKCTQDGIQLDTATQTQSSDTNSILVEGLQYSSYYSVAVAARTTTSLVGAESTSIIVETQEPLEGIVVAASVEVSVREDAGFVSVPIDRVNGSFGNVSYSFQTIDDTAWNGFNYDQISETRTLTSNVQSGVIEIPIEDDTEYNPGISFLVQITDSNTGLVSTTRVIIEDDGDAGYISFRQADVSPLENCGITNLEITRTGGSSPAANIQVDVVQNASSMDRFHLLNPAIVFDEGVVQQYVSVEIVDDDAFEYVPDKITLQFSILDGGALNGEHTTCTLTAADDGDVSLPKQCTNLRKTSVTGGALGLQWTAPLDHGGLKEILDYSVSVTTGNQLVKTQISLTETTVVYGLTQSTTYQIAVQARNSRWTGVASPSLLVATLAATPPTAPMNIHVTSASSSMVTLSWDAPLDDGGSPIVSYTVFNAGTSVRSLFPSISCNRQTVCTIKQLLALTSYSVQIQASSAFESQGVFSEVTTFETSRPDYPEQPPPANVTWVSAGAMTIRMFDPVNVGGSSIQEYRLYIQADGDPDFKPVYSGASRVYTVYRLRYETDYFIKYQAVNSVGPSGYSATIMNQTLQKTLPSAPTHVAMIDRTGGAITLEWGEPLDIAGRDITGYTIRIVSINGTVANMVGYDGKGNPSRTGTVYDLIANTQYGMQVVAYIDVSNCFDTKLAAWSAVINVTTLSQTPPRTSPELLVGGHTGGIIQFVWVAPKDKGGVPLTGYTLYLVDTADVSTVLFSTSNTSVLTFTHNDLTANTNYSYAITTSNAAGVSPTSAVLQTSTDSITAPSAPVNVRQLTYNTGGAISVGWDRSFDTGGQQIGGYMVYRFGELVSGVLPSTARAFTNKDQLQASTSYNYTVRSRGLNAMASMASDQLVASTTAATKPQQALSLSAIPGSSYLNLTWISSGDTGGIPIKAYEVKLMLGSTVVTMINVTAANALLTGLTASTTYIGSVKVYNDVGSSEELSTSLVTTAVGVPDAPKPPSIKGKYGGNFTIQVEPPLFTGGSAVTVMMVYEFTQGKVVTLNVVAGVLPTYTFFSVNAESSYSVACSAINAAGEGPQSSRTVIKTLPINPPGPILMAPVLVIATGTALNFQWSLPADTGGTLDLTYFVKVESSSSVGVNPSVGRSYNATQLVYSTVYSISVCAANIAGNGSWSPVLTAMTQPDTAGEFNFAQTSISVFENASQVAIAVQRVSGLSGQVTLTYTVGPTGTSLATVGSDYAVAKGSTATTGKIVFEPLQNQNNIVIFILNDALYENPDETFAVTIASVSSTLGVAKVGSNSKTTVTILDDGDAGFVSFESPTYSFSEGFPTATVTIIREYGKSSRISLVFEFSGGTATPDVDYRKTTTPVVMEDGVVQATLTFSIINDRVFEFPDEYFLIQMSVASGGAILRQPVTRVTILDDGDVSNPGDCPPLQPLSQTGGSATFVANLPMHNGSARGQLTNYIVRLSSDTSSWDLKKPVLPTITIGGLNATTSYSVTIAASTSFGNGNFSNVTLFSTTAPTLPGPITYMASEFRTGGRITFMWSPPDDTGGIPVTKYRVYMADTQGTKQITASITEPITGATVFANLSANTTYDFYLQAGNSLIDNAGWGNISAAFKFSTGEVTLPGPVVLHPGHYHIPTGGKLFLGWDAPIDTGGAIVSSYTIFANTSVFSWFQPVAAYAESGLSAAVTRLNANTEYQLFVLANNSVLPTKLPGSLSISMGSSVMRTTADLTDWLSVGSVITVEDAIFVVGDVSAAATKTILLTSAHSATTIQNQQGELLGQASNVISLSTTDPTFPDPPPAPIKSIATGGMVNVTVLSPEDTGGIPILDFAIYLNDKKLSEDSYLEVLYTENHLQKTAFVSVPSLDPLTSYNFSALALNSRSLCNFAPVVGPERMVNTTNVTAPSMPNLAKYKATGGGITMTMINPHDSGGKSIQTYRLYYKENATTTPWQLGYNGSKHQATVAHLKPLTYYVFMTSVNNGFFDSVNSSEKIIRTTDRSAPGACEPAEFKNATGGMLEVSWGYPPDDGGANVTHYIAAVASHVDGSGRISVNTTHTSCKFYRLLASSRYDVTVRAANGFGYGPESASVTYNTTAATPPSGEIKVNVDWTSGGAASITFDEPIDLGGVDQSEMTYNFFLDRDNIINMSYSTLKEFPAGIIGGSRRLLQTSGIISNVLVGGMDPEMLYGLQIQPTSDLKGEISSSFAVTTTVATIPSAPVKLKPDIVTGGSVSLSWGEPADLGGVPLNGYSLYISNVSESGPFTNASDDLQTESVTIYELASSTKYWVYVTASNNEGTSPSSPVIPFTTRTITPPSSPRNPQIVSVGFDSIECMWEAPDDVGGDTIKGSIVRARETDSLADPLEFPVNAFSAVLTGLKSATAYSISVIALNSFGDPSPSSVTRYAKTSPGQDIVSVPQIGCVSVDSVELLWYPYPAAASYHVFRGGTDIGTTTSSTFTDTGVFSSVTTYTIQTSSGVGPSESVAVTTIDPQYATVDVRCQGKSGHISVLNYANNVSQQWLIDPTSRHSYITLKFSSFALECDHDFVEILDKLSNVSLWKGGCVRTGRFVYQAKSSVIVRFSSDASVTQKGFELSYEIDGDSGDTRIPPPGGVLACSGHGRSQSDGTCKCSVGFTGEGCNNRVVCCSDPDRCHHSVCDMDPADVIVVSGEFGDDIQGTGQLMNAGEKGTASKAVKTLSRAVALSSRGCAILIHPGEYSGSSNRDLEISSSNLTFTTLKGPFWTSVDCEELSRFIQSASSILVVEGLTLQNCIAGDGGVFSATDGHFTARNMLITNSKAVGRGGALYTSGSNVSLDQVRIEQSSAGTEGGALHFEGSNVTMISSNVTQSTALRGGALALRGTSSLSTDDTTFEENNATDIGGALYVNGDVSLDGVVLLRNRAPNGGGIAMDNGILTMENCVVENNSAVVTGGGLLLGGKSTVTATATSIHINDAGTSGGGVYASGTINITFDKQATGPSSVLGNTALRGAGMYIFESDAAFVGIKVENGSANVSAGGVAIVYSTVDWSNVVIQDNQALEGGGLVLDNSRLTCKGPVLLKNNTAEDGGAVWVNSSTMTGVVGTRCVSNNATMSGGSIFVVGNTTVDNVDQDLNKAPRGGCMHVKNATLSLAGSTLTSCSANVSGGGIWTADSSVTVSDVSVKRSTAPDGGGLYVSASTIEGEMTVDSCTGDYYGGGMYLTGATNITGVDVMNGTAKEGGAAYAVDAHLGMDKCSLSSSHASEKGGGLYGTNSLIDLTETTVQECTCNALGGGVYLDLSTMNHDGATVENCNADAGGGLYLDESHILALASTSSSQISDNEATSSGGNVFLDTNSSVENLVVSHGDAEHGGGVYQDGTLATITGCSIVNNSATSGGGLYTQPGSVCTLADSDISMNSALNEGGGIDALDSVIIHDGLSIRSNTAPSGGGVFVTGRSRINRQNETSAQAIIRSNTATYSEPATGIGGGLYVAPSSHVEVSGLDLLDGSADRGAGVFVDGAVLVLSDSLIQNGNASYGGGLCMAAVSNVQVRNCSFVGNYASQSGGAIQSSGGEVTSNILNLNNCSIVANTASISAGGISVSTTNLTGSDNSLRENIAVNSSGGAIAFLNQGSATLLNWKLVNNSVQSSVTGRGGSIFITSGATVTIADSHVASNENATRMLTGGLIYVENAASTLTVANSTLEFGQAYSGGLIYSVDATVYLRYSTLHRGYAFNFGAGIFAVTTTLDVSDSIFYDNFAFFGGGGIFIKDGGGLIVRNSFFDSNAVEDSGGAIFLNPGAALRCIVSGSNFTRNTNAGPGSTIFVGRKNYARLTGCYVYDNGGEWTDGGSLSVVDAVVDIDNSVFESNTATKGAAIQISRAASVTVTDSTIRSNHATIEGGALHASIRAVATFINSTIERNIALEGGAVYGMGSARITLEGTNFTENNASSFGGAIAMRGSAVLTATSNVFESNAAYTGGAVSIQENASLSVTDGTFQENIAVDYGAGIYINKETETKTQTVFCTSSRFGNHTAVAGNDIYWVYYPWFVFDCIACTTPTGESAIQMSTSAMTVTQGWWPTTVTSGVSLGVKLSTRSSSGSLESTTARRLATVSSSSSSSSSDAVAATEASLNASLIKPNSTVLWPTMVVRDYYGAIASYDNVTRCRAALSSGESASFTFNPPTCIWVDRGYIVFEGAEVFSDFRDTPYQLNVSCTLSPVVDSPTLVDITVDKCNPGYENIRGVCKPCVKGTYSLDGGKCYLCPAGATCEGKDESGATIGVVFPQRQQGYFMTKTRSTFATSKCDDPDSWSSDDPCKSVNQTNLADRLLNCSGAEDFDKFWGQNRIFSCLSGNEYYACDTNTACVEAPNVSISTASVQTTAEQCAVGYTGVMCATCADDYYKGSSGTCKICHDPNDPTVDRTTHLLAMLPIFVAIAALVFLCYLFSNAAEQRIVSHAQAAKRFEVYDHQSWSRALLLAAKAKIQQQVHAMMQAVVKRTRLGAQTAPRLFQIEPRHIPVPSWRPEKFKIMLGFFQVMGSFKEVYEIPWPDDMSRLMDICSLADFNFVDTTAAECLFKRDYFANYRLALFALVGMLTLVFLVTFWGILKYRVKLSTLPRHCVSCGLPVFTLEHRSHSLLARRATLLTKLKMEQKSLAESVRKKAGPKNLLARVKAKFSVSSNQAFENANSWRVVQLVVRLLNWVDHKTQLPASIPTHKPRCPTSQRIKNEVRDMVVHSNIRLWRARVWMRLYYKAYQNRCIKLLFWVSLLFYPMFCQRVIGMFYCDEVGDHYYLSLDRSNLCYEGTWLYYLPISITLIVFWVLGVPLLFWVIIAMKRSRGVSDTILLISDPSQDVLKQRLLLKMRLDIINHGHIVNEEKIKLFETEMLTHFLRDRNLNEPSTVAQVGFIYHSYDTHFWWFEVWDLGRKLLLNCVISLLAKADANRIICGLVVMLVYLSVMLFYQPYRERSDSALAGVTNIQLFITLFCGLILKMGALYLDARVVRLVTSAAIVSNILTLIYAVFSILNEKRTAWKMAQRQSRDDHRRALAAHVRKLWRNAYGYALTEIYLSNPDPGPMPFLVMKELARREKHQQEMDDLNAQLELTAAMLPPPSPDEHQEGILAASQVDVLEEDAAPDEIDELMSAVDPSVTVEHPNLAPASQADALDEDTDPDDQPGAGEQVVDDDAAKKILEPME